MKYSMVKQFSNFAIDNAYSFVFKIVDFGKILNLLFWGFVEIWSAFFGIFYNVFMYIYYLFLFMIDRGSESTGSTIIGLKKSQKVSKIPSVQYEPTPSVVQSMYKRKTVAASNVGTPAATPVTPAANKTTVEIVPPGTSPSKLTSLKTPPSGKGAKKSFFKTVGEFIAEYATAVKNIIVQPFKLVGGLFAKKLQPVKEGEAKNVESKGTSLIDQYMKEYEKQKKR
ncbi:MAG: hypothetical protein FWF73_05450 [Spirochaetes bacterium]|nr:hypothetical protein [Spirochaetota bacterium]